MTMYRRNKFDEVCLDAVDFYGGERQLAQTQEEAAELIAAISHYRREREGSLAELIEEVADMKIMMRQLMRILDAEEVNKAVSMKIDRLEKQLKKEAISYVIANREVHHE